MVWASRNGALTMTRYIPALILLLASTAQAETPAPSSIPPDTTAATAPVSERWYGYQPAISDAVAVGLLFGAAATVDICPEFKLWDSDDESERDTVSDCEA